MASRSSHGTWVKVYSSLQAQMPRFVSTQFAWIKGHAGVQGNECSDLFSKDVLELCPRYFDVFLQVL